MNPSPGSRRFVVSAPRLKMKIVGLVMLAWVVVVGLGIMGAQALLPAKIAQGAIAPIMVLSILGYGVFLVYVLTPKQVSIDLVAGGIVVDEGRGGVFPISSAKLGVWNLPMYGVAAGTALHVEEGWRRYCLGGRDHRASPGTRFDAAPVESVDGYMSAADFDALLLALSPARAAEAQWSAPVPNLLRCLLTPNRASGTLKVMLPWFATILLVGGVNILLAALGVGDTPAGQNIGVGVTIALIFAGIGVTAARSMRTPKPKLAIEAGTGVLRVVELATSRHIAEGLIANVGAERAEHVYGGRTSYTMPVIVLRVPGAKPIHIGIPDFRFSWSDRVTRCGAPKYVVGGADWLALVELLGLRSFLGVGPG